MKIGTLLHRILQPIALMIDRLTLGHTHLATCEACKSRAAYLDSMNLSLSLKDRFRLLRAKMLTRRKNPPS